MFQTSPATASQPVASQPRRCQHVPRCPAAFAPDHAAARVIAAHPEQGWSLLCNGVVAFEDTGEILPNGTTVAPRRAYSTSALRAA
jgi:Family of unknown function (DUF5999)